MTVAENGLVFPGRDSTAANPVFFSGNGDDLEASPAVLRG